MYTHDYTYNNSNYISYSNNSNYIYIHTYNPFQELPGGRDSRV